MQNFGFLLLAFLKDFFLYDFQVMLCL
uniref:Uncharacterized protein n=1 Tax=Rhizophora mucronata TaxID=61149 RepID=A0A2P2QXI6_RHIMU